jgi:hypothetical protein
MSKKFLPAWVSCVDESMSPWTFDEPAPVGCSYQENQPHLAMNTIPSAVDYPLSCGELFWWKKDSPREITYPQDAFGKTIGVLLRMFAPIAGRGMVIVLDSGFCVLRGLIELKKIGVFELQFRRWLVSV